MPQIADPADGQVQAQRAAKLDALLDYFARWPDASAMKSGDPALLCDTIRDLRARLAAAEARVERAEALRGAALAAAEWASPQRPGFVTLGQARWQAIQQAARATPTPPAPPPA